MIRLKDPNRNKIHMTKEYYFHKRLKENTRYFLTIEFDTKDRVLNIEKTIKGSVKKGQKRRTYFPINPENPKPDLKKMKSKGVVITRKEVDSFMEVLNDWNNNREVDIVNY